MEADTAGRGPQGMAGPRRNKCQIICISHHESFRTLCDNEIQVRRHISWRSLVIHSFVDFASGFEACQRAHAKSRRYCTRRS